MKKNNQEDNKQNSKGSFQQKTQSINMVHTLSLRGELIKFYGNT